MKFLYTLFVILPLLVYSSHAFAQDSLSVHFDSQDSPPEATEGLDAFRKYVSQHYRVSRPMSKAKLRGEVSATFVVEKDGSISTVKVEKDLGYGSGEELVRVLEKYAATKKWNPGYQKGKAVRVQYRLPLKIYVP